MLTPILLMNDERCSTFSFQACETEAKMSLSSSMDSIVLIESSATKHMTPCKQLFSMLHAMSDMKREVQCASGSFHGIKENGDAGDGDVILPLVNGKRLKLHNVLYVPPDLTKNLVSV